MIFGLNLQNNPQTSLFILFGVVITIFLIFDLGFFNKTAHKVSLKAATFQSIFWVVISVIFGFLIYKYDGGTIVALEFYSAYITEYALSVDNIFVILLILRYFKVEEKFYHKILFWGVLGAIVFRAIFIFLGAYLIGQFHWILYIFGAFLVYTGVKIFFQEDDDDLDPEQNVIIKFARKYLRITKGHFNGQFIIRRGRKILFTPLFLVILLIESTDLIFAVDSIPAVFAISQSEFILYTSNIFAILGLRAKFFLLAGIIDKFHLLQKGLSFILIFIGGKMLLEFFDIQISTVVSFTVIFAILVLSILMSLLIPKREESSLTNQEN
jgi:tellurite resistance protein TerC